MLPQVHTSKISLRNLNRIPWPLIYLRVNLEPLISTGNHFFEDNLQELNIDFAKICISPKPSGAPMGKFPYKF